MSCLVKLSGRKLKLAKLAEVCIGKKFTNIVEDVRVRNGNIEVFASFGGAIYSHWSDVCNYEAAKERKRSMTSVWTPRKTRLKQLVERVQGKLRGRPPLDARVRNDVIELLIDSDTTAPYWVAMCGYSHALEVTSVKVIEPVADHDTLWKIAQHHFKVAGREMPNDINDVFVSEKALVIQGADGLAVWSTVYETAKAAFDEWEANSKTLEERVPKVNWENIVPVLFFKTFATTGQFSQGVAR